MVKLHHVLKGKYLIIELVILFFLCFVRPLISDLEYSAYEQKDISRFSEGLEERIVWGIFSFVFLSVYYFAVLKKLVMANQHLLVIITLPGFVFFYHLYDFYVMDQFIANMNFLSEKIRNRSVLRLQRSNLYFPFNYVLSYNYLPLAGMAYMIRAFMQQRQIGLLKEQQLLSELKYLKDKLHPHFFFNTLNNIYALAIQQSEQTAPMVAGLANLMRYMLYESDKNNVPLKKEIEMLQEYVELEKIRYSDKKINISFETQGIVKEDTIAPLLLLPFVENAFKHGIQDELQSGHIEIVICRIGDQLILKVSNSIPPAENEQQSGIGLTVVEQRLKLLYGNDYHLKVLKDKNRYEVILSLKMNS